MAKAGWLASLGISEEVDDKVAGTDVMGQVRQEGIANRKGA
jgi:hypothetical protein